MHSEGGSGNETCQGIMGIDIAMNINAEYQ